MENNHRTKLAGRNRSRQKLTSSHVIAVIASFAILIGLIVTKILSGPDEAKRVIAKQEIATIVQALNLYRRDHGRYPTQEPGLHALIEKPSIEIASNTQEDRPYLERLPNDPWGNLYQYRNPGVHGQIDVFSYGADGKQGGEGDDADIGSWEQAAALRYPEIAVLKTGTPKAASINYAAHQILIDERATEFH